MDIVVALPGTVALLALAYTIYKDYSSRRLELYFKAISGLSEKASAARSSSILALQSIITTYRRTQESRERQSRTIQILSTHLLTETDPFVRSLCARAIAASNFQMRGEAIGFLYELNQVAWNNRNLASLGENGVLEDQQKILQAVNEALILLLKQPRPQSINLRGVHFDGCNLSGVDLRGCDLTEATLTHVALSGARLEDAVLDRAIIINSYLSDISLESTSLKDTVVCCCHLERLRNSRNLDQTKILAGNKYKETEQSNKEISDEGKREQIYLTKELDWVGIWVPSDAEGDGLDAEWRTPYSDERVKADIIKVEGQGGETFEQFRRQQSNDGNDGEYSIQKKGRIFSSAEYIAGERVLRADKQNWEAVRWTMR